MTRQPTTVAPHKLARLVEISRILNSATNVDTALTYIIKQAAALTESEAASILLLDPNTQQLHFRASSNHAHDEMINIPVPLDGSIAGAIFRENKPMVISDVSKDSRWNPDVSRTIQFQTQSILGVPMHDVVRQPIGVLEALNKTNGAFTREDAKTLTILADIAGVALERARLAEDLERAYQELNELDQLKTDFIAVASHELRTPLSVIMGYVSFLQEEADAHMASQLDSVMHAAVHLRDLIQAMLNLSYVDTGKAAIELEPVDLAAYVGELTREPHETAVTKQQTIRVHLPTASLPVQLDKNVMAVALNNLINNAVKFSPPGSHIDIRVTAKGQEAWFSIQDNGPGIPEDKLERIFNRFYQLEPSLVRQHGGLGLGLAIAKDLVNLQNGRIWAESTEKQGSIFYVALPLSQEG